MRRDVLAVAAHEVSHGLAWRAAGFSAGPARLSRGLFGGVSDARCGNGAERLTEANVTGYLVGCAAGAAGQRLFVARYLGGRDGGAGAGASSDRADHRWVETSWCTGTSWSAAERRATALLRPRLTRIERLVVQLARTGHLPRSAFH